MAARVCVGLSLLSLSLSLLLSLSGVHSGANITILSLPVNLTAWKTSFREALNHSLSNPLDGLRRRFKGVLDFARNGSIDCTGEGEECIPEYSSCCPTFSDGDNFDLQCLPEGDYFVCIRPSSSEELTRRFDELQYGDSMGRVDSHPWANSWAFQSRSEEEKQEVEIAEDEEWKKNYVPDNTDNFWVKLYNKIKSSGKGVWRDIRKFKQLQELKANLIERYKKRVDRKNQDTPEKERDDIERDDIPTDKEKEMEPLFPKKVPSEQAGEESSVLNAGEMSNEPEGAKSEDARSQDKTESGENFIKFSDEMPEREKKINFRIDDIVKDALDLVNEKFKRKKTNPDKHSKKINEPSIHPASSEEMPFHLDDVRKTEKSLMKELYKLKELKEKQNVNKNEHKLNEPDIEELIRRQVSAILEEERKLDKLKKIEELRRLEEMRDQGR